MSCDVVRYHKKVDWYHKTMEASIDVTIAGFRQMEEFLAHGQDFYFHGTKTDPKEWALKLRFDKNVEPVMKMLVYVSRKAESPVRVLEGNCTAFLPAGNMVKDLPGGVFKATKGSASG